MDMDYDIPLPEELESLEADSYFHDDHDFYPDLDLPEQHPPDSPPFLHPQINGHNKRPRSDAPDSPLDDTQLPSDEKRTKIVDRDIVEDEEEDQSRYSPPLLAVDTEDVRVVEEKILPSYAFEIDGECMPVRARRRYGLRQNVSVCDRRESEEYSLSLCATVSRLLPFWGFSARRTDRDFSVQKPAVPGWYCSYPDCSFNLQCRNWQPSWIGCGFNT